MNKTLWLLLRIIGAIVLVPIAVMAIFYILIRLMVAFQ